MTITTEYASLNNQTAFSKDLEKSNEWGYKQKSGTPTYKSQPRYTGVSRTGKNASKKRVLNMMLQRMLSNKPTSKKNQNNF